MRLSLLHLAAHSHGLVGRSNLPPSFSVSDLGTCDSVFPNVYRDGGGGGTVNGKNVIVYSDTTTTTGGLQDQMRGFVANTIAIVGATFTGWMAANPVLIISFRSLTPTIRYA